ncbi:hypothetical protein HY310_01415, partial [Candidatus Microgenomates bacterium]|nr:hypothetical protein [Candidatus Microgenomates bacterium]
TANSQIISVVYNTEGPGTPTVYSKEKASSCQYKITYKTADDGGKTNRVEIYSSLNKSFDINSSTKVGSQTVGSNSDGVFSFDTLDCGKEYYFAIRALDVFGNASGVVGDRIIVVEGTTSTTNTTTSQPQGGAIPVSGVNLASVPIVETKEEKSTLSGETVLGTSTSAAVEVVNLRDVKTALTTNKKVLVLITGLVGLLVLTIVYVFFKRRQKP